MKPSRLLIVDDEPGMLRAVERVLGRRHQVVSYELPLDALAHAREYNPDLAILDVRMPQMDGFELMARLRELVPGIDIILMTGSASEPDQKLIRAVRENAFYFIQKPFDSEVLRTLVERCLELRHLAEDNRRHVRRLEGELSQATAFQRSLLPREEAVINGFRLAGRYQPTSELGGDFFDFARVGTTGAALVIADVSGHGVSAAMLTGIVKAGFRAAQVEDFDPVAVVEQVHASLKSFGADQFVTMIAARLSAEKGLEYVNAGHPTGLLTLPGGSIERLETTGPIVSQIFPAGSWSAETRSFTEGAHLLLYTDGISEARSPTDELFGEERVAAAARRLDGGGNLLDHLLTEVREWSGGRPIADDLTLVLAMRPN
ncbi:MAG: SpoIIE family protein phosphatase [Candidatus Eisenbacteria bacterium]|nr:SpoIIE family protein phosphatase [Candidatus Eisenbacteria bacterium]